MSEMKLSLDWQDKMQFKASDGKLSMTMDAKSPIGSDTALTPKQLFLASIMGCSAMDVVSLMRKYKQDMKSFHIDAQAPLKEGHPAVFTHISIQYRLDGAIELEKAFEAAKLSMTKFCGVSAMVSTDVPIEYEVFVNGVSAGKGRADFSRH